MVATNRPRWFDHRGDPNWSSLVVSVAITIGAFGAALVAMTSVRWLTDSNHAELEATAIVHLEVPSPAPATVRVPKVDVMRAPVARAERTEQPPIARPTSVDPPVAAPIPLPATPGSRDTASLANPGPVIPLGPVHGAGPFGDAGAAPRLGAPAAPAGVTVGSRAANTEQVRDSIASDMMRQGASEWLTDKFKPKGAELAALESSRRLADRLMRRTTSAGAWQGIHVPMGEGLGGVGAVGGRGGLSPTGGSVSLPLFSSGPSAAQRKKNEQIDADNRARLRRLQDRVRLVAAAHADSAHADSVRRVAVIDSLHRDSLARVSRAPVP